MREAAAPAPARRAAFCFLLASVLLVGLLSILSFSAWATDEDELSEEELAESAEEAAEAVEEAELTLEEAEARMAELTAECEELQAEIDAMQEQIDELAAAVLEAQSAKLSGRSALAEIVEYQYRNSSLIDLLAFLFDSESFSDFLRNLTYLSSLVDYFTDAINEQQENIDTFNAISATLTAQKDAQEEKMAELESKIEEAAALVESAAAALEDAEDEQDRIAELQAQAAALAAAGELTEPVMVEEANTVDRQSVVSDDTPVIGDTVTSTTEEEDEEEESQTADADAGTADADDDAADADDSDASDSDASDATESADSGTDDDAADTSADASTEEESSTEEEDEDDDSSSSSYGYRTGIASAYGGETDPYTPNPGITATGAVCDDESMGVAVPMSWENYWEYYGRIVEITYNGITVYAVVNDCGYMGGGTRDLDLQPGVWKAFGFTSCTEWGLRLVTYRFL